MFKVQQFIILSLLYSLSYSQIPKEQTQPDGLKEFKEALELEDSELSRKKAFEAYKTSAAKSFDPGKFYYAGYLTLGIAGIALNPILAKKILEEVKNTKVKKIKNLVTAKLKSQELSQLLSLDKNDLESINKGLLIINNAILQFLKNKMVNYKSLGTLDNAIFAINMPILKD